MFAREILRPKRLVMVCNGCASYLVQNVRTAVNMPNVLMDSVNVI